MLVRAWGQGLRVVLPHGPGSAQWSGNGSAWRGFDAFGRPVPLRFSLPVTVAQDGDVAGSSDLARFDLREECFREPVVPRVREERAPTNLPELKPVAPLHFLETGQVPIARAFDVALKAEPGAHFLSERVGIFVQDRDEFRYIDTERQEGRGWVARTRTLRGIGLFEDSVSPTLGEPRLEEYDGRVRLVFRAEDEGAGIDCDDVQVFHEGAPIIHELDDETGDVVAYPSVALAPGDGGEFELRATDRCGNASQRVDRVRLE